MEALEAAADLPEIIIPEEFDLDTVRQLEDYETISLHDIRELLTRDQLLTLCEQNDVPFQPHRNY